MNSRLIVFIIVSILAVGSVVVYTKNNVKLGNDEKAGHELSNFGSPETVVSQSESPIKRQTSLDVNEVSLTPTQGQNQNMQQNITELTIEELKEGSGEAVKSGDSVEVNYLGTFLDGKKFDSSYDRNETFSFNVGAGQVISGWDQGLVGMKVGGKRKLLIPSDLAYGPNGSGPIPSNTPLVFEIELISIK